jgi:hypothetical protein
MGIDKVLKVMNNDLIHMNIALKHLFAASILAVIAVAFLIYPHHAFADTDVSLCPQDAKFGVLCTNARDAGVFAKIVQFIIRVLLVAAVVIAVIFLIIGGIKWILSGGDKAQVEAARNTIVASIIGLVIAFVAFILINIVATAFGIGDVFNLTLPTLFP